MPCSLLYVVPVMLLKVLKATKKETTLSPVLGIIARAYYKVYWKCFLFSFLF